ncbi:MAG: hypothetical protein H6737_17840 [Alphaproteobacteria bacterium]|nr:hypothetical protein [Alphaproteobacteria bacterium]
MKKLFVALSLLSVAPAIAGPGDEPRPHFGASTSLSEEDEARLLQEVASRDPERAEQLARLKTRDPARYYEVLGRVARGLDREARDPEARARHERIQGIRHEIKALAIEYQAAPDGEKKKLRKEMEKLAGDIFDLRQEERRARLDDLRERLKEAEAEVAEQDANRDAVIAEHLDALLQGEPK